MAYSEILADKIRGILAPRDALVEEKKMFGGLSFMVGGHMCCGVVKDDLMLRIGPDKHAEALAWPDARPMDFTGRPMKGMVYVGPSGWQSDKDLIQWLDMALAFARSLPPKKHETGKSRNKQ